MDLLQNVFSHSRSKILHISSALTRTIMLIGVPRKLTQTELWLNIGGENAIPIAQKVNTPGSCHITYRRQLLNISLI